MKRVAVIGLLFATAAGAQTAATDIVLVPEKSTVSVLSDFKKMQVDVGNDPTVVVDLPQSRSDLKILRSTVPDLANVRSRTGNFDRTVVPLSSARIAKVEADIGQLLKNEPQSPRSFLGTLRDEFKQTLTPYLAIDPIAVADPNTAAVFANGESGQFGTNASVATALLRARSKGFAVKASELQFLPTASQITNAATAAFLQQYNLTLKKLTATLSDPTPANQSAFADDAALTRRQFVTIWPTLRNDAAKRSDAVRRLAGLEQQSSLKAVYSLPSNFAPASYGRIYDQSLRTVALYERGEQFCSGYLVSAEWVMTAGHCLQRGDVQGMSVSVSAAPCPDELRLQDDGACVAATNASAASTLTATSVPVDDKWPATGTGFDDSDPIDFVFLHIGSTPTFENIWKRIETRAPLCLSSTPLDYEQAAFVIAYQPGSDPNPSRNPSKVYDHAYIWFPFRVAPQNFQTVSAMTGAKLQRLAEAWFASPTDQVNFFNKNMTSFENAYEVNGGFREYRTERAGLGKRPYFGMDTDTYKGNSGAPVFSRSGVCVIGVFSGGAMENAQIDESTWKEHEFAMPLSEVDGFLRNLDPATGNPSPEQLAARKALLALLPQ